MESKLEVFGHENQEVLTETIYSRFVNLITYKIPNLDSLPVGVLSATICGIALAICDNMESTFIKSEKDVAIENTVRTFAGSFSIALSEMVVHNENETMGYIVDSFIRRRRIINGDIKINEGIINTDRMLSSSIKKALSNEHVAVSDGYRIGNGLPVVSICV